MGMIEMQSFSFTTGRNCNLTAKGKNPDPINARNILAMIQGSDKELRNEYVIIGGHLDHIGMDETGKIWNGADDNASGVAVMLGIASAMREQNFRPKRTVVFAAWTGEEMGLLGSKAWCEKPTIDMNRIVVYFNLDMVGLGNGNLNMPGTGYAPEVTDFIKNNLDTAILGSIIWSEGGPGGSDHNNFLSQGIPAFAGMTAGTHPDYHQPGDDPEKMDRDILQLTGDFIYQSSGKLANADLTFLSAEQFEDNMLKLFSFSVFNPVNNNGFVSRLKDKNFRIGILKFPCINAENSANENFIKLIYALDSALNNVRTGRSIMSATAYDAMMGRQSLLAAFYPEAVNNDELKIKVLSRLGYRFAIIDKFNTAYNDTAVMHKILHTTRRYGIGVILDGLDSARLRLFTSYAADPCLIINTRVEDLSDATVQNIHLYGHVVVFNPQLSAGMESEYFSFMKLQALAGIDNVLLSPAEFDDANLKYLQKFVKQINNRTPDKDAQYKIMGDNFYNLAVRSLQAD